MALQSVRFYKLSYTRYGKKFNDAVGKSCITVSRFLHGTSESPIIWVNNESKWVMGYHFTASLTAVFGFLLNLNKPPISYQLSRAIWLLFTDGSPTFVLALGGIQ